MKSNKVVTSAMILIVVLLGAMILIHALLGLIGEPDFLFSTYTFRLVVAFIVLVFAGIIIESNDLL